MPSPYTTPPITDLTALLAFIRDGLNTTRHYAIDGLNGDLNPSDALTLILSTSEHTLAVVQASKDTQ